MATSKSLKLTFHGRILDHLGIQMYQSPVASIAELISNSWDADAENVTVILPEELSAKSEILIEDNGSGMTFEECENKFLIVGHCRRVKDPKAKSPIKQRPILGRKGIGKLAGFGIAKKIVVTTVSKSNGELTQFEMNLDELRGDEYVGKDPKNIIVTEYEPPSDERKKKHGTTIKLQNLTLARRPTRFDKAMARRFLLMSRVDDFQILINGKKLVSDDEPNVEFDFPNSIKDEDIKKSLTEDDISFASDGWADEILPDGNQVRWRVVFYEKPIEEDELRGISVFANGKLAQSPFNFNLTGGLGGQHGLEYMSGQVQADFLDELPEDLISPERQRVNWEHPEAQVLLDWGQKRIQILLRIWQKERNKKKIKILEDKLEQFSERLDRLQPSEKKTLRSALDKLAGIPALSDTQFKELGSSIVTAMEKGRLSGLIDKIATATESSEQELLQILIEANVLDALNMAEAVRTKIEIIEGLQTRIERKDLENAIRDYISEHPWLVGPRWETFRVERTLKKLLSDVASEVKTELGSKEESKRLDLVLASGNHLLVLEFMQPGITVDQDHLHRFDLYVRILRTHLAAQTGGPYTSVSGYIVADKLSKKGHVLDKIKSMAKEEMYAMDWETLLQQALRQWDDFLDVLGKRDPNDSRLKEIVVRK